MKRETIVPVLTEHIKKLPYKILLMATDWNQRNLKRPHGVEFYILMQCISGEGFVIYNDKKIIVSPNDIFLWAPNVPQYYYSEDTKNWVVNWISFEADKIPFDIEEGFFITHFFPKSLGIAKFDTIKELLMTESISGQIRASSALYDFLCDINIYSQQLDKFDDSFDLNSVISYMKQNVNKNISLKELSQLFNISESYLCRIFKRKFKTTPIQYFIELKMSKAKEILLLNPEEKIYKVAELCGYDDPVYFSRVFKKYVHKTPSMYRNE